MFSAHLATSVAAPGVSDATRGYGAVQSYRQVLVVECRGEGGDVPVPELAPVYDGRPWALSTRWDDSNPNALNIRRKMLENGIRGTFYLNSRQPETAPEALACKLSANAECSVGGHSVSHPHLQELSANASFHELVANRITLECLTDRPVNSLAFPYGGDQEKDRPDVLQGITEAFLRAGYHHCVYSGFVLHNTHLPEGLVTTGVQVVPGDRQVNAAEFWVTMDKIKGAEAGYRKTSDCIFLGVHPWQQGEELERLGEVMGKLRNWSDFWYCTQTEYAAFAKQRHATTVIKATDTTFALERPCAYDLGNDIPLTLIFPGGTVVSATVDGVECTVRQAEGISIVNVPHTGQHGVPVKIDAATDGVSSEFPDLKPTLQFDRDTGAISFSLANAGPTALDDVVLTVSGPPAFDPGMLRRRQATVAAGTEWSVAATVSVAREGSYWRDGEAYVAAQLDFVLKGERGRLFAICVVP